MGIEFLNPNRKLVDEVVDWLFGKENLTAGRIRLKDGAKSLAHIMVVVPTAQAGRSLRLALAKEATRRGWGGVLAPSVVQPMQLVKSADSTARIATSTELRATFLEFVTEASADSSIADFPHLFKPDLVHDFRAQLAFFDQLQDIWRILAGGGMTMADVPNHEAAKSVLAQALGDEATRWAELAEFESHFFERLHAKGLRHQAADIKLAKTYPAPIPNEIEEVVLPALADPIRALYPVLEKQRPELKRTVLLHSDASDAARFDEWGRPNIEAWIGPKAAQSAGLKDSDIHLAASDRDLARQIAKDFPSAEDPVCRPSLGLCDDALFTELSAAFLNRGYVLYNPERHPLAVSSLGRIINILLDLYAARKKDCLPWQEFAALMREQDILAAFVDGKDGLTRSSVLAGIDVCQNTFLPVTIPFALNYDSSIVYYHDRPLFKLFLAFAGSIMTMLKSAWSDNASSVEFLRRALGAIFANRALSGSDSEREFRAATDSVRAVLEAFDSDAILKAKIGEAALIVLLRKAFAEAAYSLESVEHNAVSTEGWLELVWSAADKIALVGFTDGAVPDSVVGHPFVPDNLRIALGLMSNAGRLARDAMLLNDIIRSRGAESGSVRAYLALTNAEGDQRRPSRLLFRVETKDLARRVKHLFGEVLIAGADVSKRGDSSWRLNLPTDLIPLPNVSEKNPLGRLSASAIDEWLKCPFSYLLKYGLGMDVFKPKDEFEANDFGSLVHGVLEDYANEQLERSSNGLNQLTNERDIALSLERLLEARKAKFGAHLPIKLQLQFESVKGRLLAFAPLQASWAQEGWQICEQPEYSFNVHPFASEDGVDLPFKGSIDRIDRKGDDYRLIDYKTWDSLKDVKKRIIIGGKAQIAHLEKLKLPAIESVVKKTGEVKRSRFLSVEWLLYSCCLSCADEKFKGHIADCCYVILGRDDSNIGVLGSSFDQGNFTVNSKFKLLDHLETALETARTAIRRIRGNFFWPPGPGDNWKYDYRGLFFASPERDLPPNSPWRIAQAQKLLSLEEEAPQS